MSDAELDAAITACFKTYEEVIRLPVGFRGRFVGSVRRKRRMRRIWTLGLLCATAAACMTVLRLSRPVAENDHLRPSLTARTAGTNETTQVSYWVLLGYLRECFSRCRLSRRKEEE